MDDVAVMSKVAAKKNGGYFGRRYAEKKASGSSENFPFMGHCKVPNKQSNHFTHRFFC
jgi:hypothetical protein